MLTKQLSDILQNLQSPGDFYSTGTKEIFPPCLEVNQVGRISLPLLSVQAEQLVKVAERAPYGKGYETLVDTEVRRTWQINVNQVNLSGKYWQKDLADIVNHVKLDLGVDCAVSAELYKLLVYDAGCFFSSHRDTEKTDGMFATLIIVLPSLYSGGELLVRHQQEEVKLDLRSQEPEEISFAAFYADCVHEVLPITEGCRLTLVYNLIRTNKKIPLPTPPDYRQAQQKVAALLNNWALSLNKKNEEDTPEKLIFLLEHEYSIAELKFDALKNKDAASADVLCVAAKKSDCDLYLALVSIEESGSAEYFGGGYYNHWDENVDEDDFEIGEVIDHYEKISEWRCPDGSQPVLPALPFKAEEFCPPEDFEHMEASDVEFQEATGNAGASFERMYHCAALVLWPRAHYLAIINQAGLNAALSVLKELCQQWKNNKEEKTKQEAHTLASYILRDWMPLHCEQQSNSYRRSQHIAELLKCLYHLRDVVLINRLCLIIAKKGIYQKEASVALAQASKLLPWSDVVSYTTDAITVSAVKAQAACITLLSGLCRKREKSDRQQLRVAAHVLFKALPGDTKRFPGLPPWQQQRMALTAGDVADILVSFCLIDSDLAEQTLDYMLAWPTIYGMDEILLPTALDIVGLTTSNELSTVMRLHQLVITHLQTRLAEPLEPPADWSRDNTIKCSCNDCRGLRQFLINAEKAQWRLKAVESRRSHVQHSIDMNKCDIDYVTEKKSRPYSLICTKNQASYQRRVVQSQRDQEALARLLDF
ncbi:MAG: 2OG-Fe(II) oxygenase [Methylococcaceae bacterium]|nr:2OG-Fe(II) oxygenase [Methylococcaceae bacterium]